MAKTPDDFIDTLVQDLKPVAPIRHRTGMTNVILSLMAGAAAVCFTFGVRADLMAGRPDPMFLVSTGVFLVLALATAWAAIDTARPFVGARRDGWGWTVMMAAVMPAGAVAIMASRLWRHQALGLHMDGVECLTVSCVTGVLTALALITLIRRGAPSSPARAGLFTGVSAGAAGVVAVSLCCPHGDLVHIGVWHGGAVVLSGLVGRLVLPRILAW